MSSNADEDYLNLAQKADRAAAVAQSPDAKQYWQRVAEEYRSLGARNLESDQLQCAVAAIRNPSAVQDQCSEATLYRLDLRGRTGVVVGPAEFDAPDAGVERFSGELDAAWLPVWPAPGNK